MNYPTINAIEPFSEMISTFTGYNHNLSCVEGAYFDMKNMTSDYFPALSPRKQRGICHTFVNFQGMIDKDGLVWVDNGELYINGTKKTGISLTTTGMKTIEKMGAYLVFFPDSKWYNTKDNTSGNIDNTVTKNESISFTLTRDDGTPIVYHDAEYYETHDPQNGDYKMETVNGTTSLTVYSSITNMWNSVPTTCMKIQGTGIGAGFEKGDGVKITVDLTNITWPYAANIFINDEGNNKRSGVFPIIACGNDYVIVTALLQENKTFGLSITLERKAPTMAFIVECQNRLWGCSADGHEVYCSKLGDVKNWNVFEGISTDSWAATIGSDGVFTGAVNYQGYPLFFKEDSYIRIGISTIGAHTTKETKCRGVAQGSEKSLALVNEVLFYKSSNAVCVFDGSYPTEISNNLGDVIYTSAVGGSLGNKYYICLRDIDSNYTLFTYDINKGLWIKEDDTNVIQFCNRKTELFFVSANTLYSVRGSDSTGTENKIRWMVESGNIGYLYTGKQNARRINTKSFIQRLKIQARLEQGSHISIYINYDSTDVWEFLWDISGTGTNLTSIPIRPHRCNHFRYRIVGYGDAKIFSVTKDYIEGSDR